MEFWGIEVKPGQTVKCEAGDESILHLSQSSLGETRKEKGYENVPVFVKVNDQKLVIGTLSADKCAQIQHDLIFEKEFELSHGSKNTSVFFIGYKGVNEIDEPEDGFDDSSSDDEFEFDEKENGKTSKNEHRKSITEKATVGMDSNMTAKLKANAEKPKKEQLKADKKAKYKDLVDDSDEYEDDSDEDEDIVESSGDSSEEDDKDSSEEEATPEKVETDKKRKSNSASKTPFPEKKAKIVTPAVNPKTGGAGKKAHVHVATPHPAKRGGKPQHSSISGGSITCKSCNRTFNSENAFQAHSKSKHGDASK